MNRPPCRSAKRVNPEAYEAFLKGRYFWNKRTADGLKKAIDYFNQAIGKDPNYAPAYAGLDRLLSLAGDWQYGVLAPTEAYPKAKAAAARAIAVGRFPRRSSYLARVVPGWLRLGLGRGRQGVHSRSRPEPRLRHRSSLVRLAPGHAGPPRRSRRRIEEGGESRSPLPHHQRGSGGRTPDRASL